MSDERVIVSVKRDHIHQFNQLFRNDGGQWIAQPEVFFNVPGIAADMGNMLGAMHQAEEAQYGTGPKWSVKPAPTGTAAGNDPDNWKGPLEPNSLAVNDWRVHAQNPGLWNRHDIFASTDVGAAAAQNAGDMAQRVDLDTYKGAFSQWLVKG